MFKHFIQSLDETGFSGFWQPYNEHSLYVDCHCLAGVRFHNGKNHAPTRFAEQQAE